GRAVAARARRVAWLLLRHCCCRRRVFTVAAGPGGRPRPGVVTPRIRSGRPGDYPMRIHFLRTPQRGTPGGHLAKISRVDRWRRASGSPPPEVDEQPPEVLRVLLHPVIERLDVLAVEEPQDVLLQLAGALARNDLDQGGLLGHRLV